MERADNKVIHDGDVQGIENDSLGCKLGGKLNGLYYYYLEEGLFASGLGADNTSILGTTDAICNVTYTPFFQITAQMLNKIPYDVDRFGEVTGSQTPNVFRINPLFSPSESTLISKSLYNIQKPSKGTPRNFRYESKLQDYPYRSIIFYSNVFDKYEVIPHLVDKNVLHGGKISLNCCCPVSAQGNYYLNVQGYKDVTKNSILERYFVNSSMDIPNTSSAYSNYIATQKARTSVNVTNSILQGFGSVTQGAMQGAIQGGLLGGLPSAFLGGAGSFVSAYANTMSTINSNMATKKDMITTPNSLKSAGGDLIARLGMSTQTEVFAGDLAITDEYKQKIGDYFAMYGYKQNKIMDISKDMLRSRHYYNYIKTIGCNIKGAIPKNYINQIKQIFDNGITLWHVDRNGGLYQDYQFDNTEV